jgi:hypothetical protein
LTIKDAAEALETARYANFWSILNSRGPVFAAIPTWKDDIRKSKWFGKERDDTVLSLSCCRDMLPSLFLLLFRNLTGQ